MKLKLVALIATIGFLIFSSITIYSMENADLMQYFINDTQKIIEDNIQYYEDVIIIDDYKITLEQSLSDDFISIIIVSVEGLTHGAREILDLGIDMFDSNIGIEFNFVNEFHGGNLFSLRHISELNEYCTPNKHYYSLEVNYAYNIESVKLYFDRKVYPELYLEVPIENDLESISIKPNVLVENNFYKTMIKNINISNIGIFTELEDFIDFQDSYSPKPEMFFLMANGEIKTISQLTNNSNIFDSSLMANYRAFNKTLDLSDINSIIISNTAYPLDGGEPQKIHIDENLRYFKIKPIIINGENTIYAPIEELCEKLGAEFKWIRRNETFSIDYRDKNLELTIGADTAILNGEEISMISDRDYETDVNINEDTQIYDDVLISCFYIFKDIFDVDFNRTLIHEEPINWEVIIIP